MLPKEHSQVLETLLFPVMSDSCCRAHQRLTLTPAAQSCPDHRTGKGVHANFGCVCQKPYKDLGGDDTFFINHRKSKTATEQRAQTVFKCKAVANLFALLLSVVFFILPRASVLLQTR